MPDKKKELLTKLDKTYCRLKPSKIEGVGVFAIRDIPNGIDPFSDVCEYDGCLFSKEDIEKLPSGVYEMIKDLLVFESDGSVLIPECGLHSLDISFFVNHSEHPNIKPVRGGEAFITIREIKKGEELVSSYDEYDKLSYNYMKNKNK